MQRWQVSVGYSVDVILEDDPEEARQKMIDKLTAFGARNVVAAVVPWTGAGEHEWVSSSVLGLNRTVCVKCLQVQGKAPEDCPGVS